jgi:hypothetical protein
VALTSSRMLPQLVFLCQEKSVKKIALQSHPPCALACEGESCHFEDQRRVASSSTIFVLAVSNLAEFEG